jgi:hypothetical protein
MSLYNLLHGENPHADLLKGILNLDGEDGKWNTGRYRDIYLNEDGTKIVLYTRNGGGNRECWQEWNDGEPCDCTGCTMTSHIPKHPNYVCDYDDDFDCTYAYVEYSIPDDFKVHLKGLSTGKSPKSVHERFTETIEEMKKMDPEDLKKDPRFKPMADVLEKIVK